MAEWDFKCSLIVRDYEIDMQGIVHHSVYINYLEHCRALYVKAAGIDVHEYHQKGYDLVVISLMQEYKSSLYPGESFYVTVKASRQGKLKVIFTQEIRREKDDSLVLEATVVTICIEAKTRRPCMPSMLEEALVALSHCNIKNIKL